MTVLLFVQSEHERLNRMEQATDFAGVTVLYLGHHQVVTLNFLGSGRQLELRAMLGELATPLEPSRCSANEMEALSLFK